MKLWKQIRTAVFASAFAGAMIAGAVQATASPPAAYVPAPAATEAPAAETPAIVPEDTEGASCTQWACRLECAPFGGHLVPGGPGKPLQCACCG